MYKPLVGIAANPATSMPPFNGPLVGVAANPSANMPSFNRPLVGIAVNPPVNVPSYNRDPRIRAREEERDKLKTEVDELNRRNALLESENQKLREGKVNAIVQRQMQEAFAQMTQMETAMNYTVKEKNELRGRVNELIKANNSLKSKLAEFERGQSPPKLHPTYALTDMTTSAVRFAVDEYRRLFENREREMESRMTEWQAKADRAMDEMINLHDELSAVKKENESLRDQLKAQETSSAIAINSVQGSKGISVDRDLPFRKRFKKFHE